MHECPKCGQEMVFVEGEPDVGINEGWECQSCGFAEGSELPDLSDW